MKEIKLYQIVFNEYASSSYESRITISTAHHNLNGNYVDENGKNFSFEISHDYETLNIPNLFIIEENEIEKYKKFGNGIKELKYVGSRLVEESEEK